MTNRLPVSTVQNRWHDAQRVDQRDMDAEQTNKNQNDAAIVNNHFGSGVLPYSPTQNVIFDSEQLTAIQAALKASNDFDGTGQAPHAQPTDSNLGNQLEVTLADGGAFGRLSTKVLIIGLDFEGNTQYDRFYFYKDNDTQVTRKHYTRILTLFFYDYFGNNNCSRNLGGHITIKETRGYQLSRDTVMVAQDVEPNLFFRDFKTSGLVTGANQTVFLYNTLQEGMGSEYSVDSLNINTNVKLNRYLAAGDVTSKIGQKFRATTDNIQKITLLLGASRDDSAAVENRYDWSGDLVVSIYELQTTTACPTDVIPELSIEFEPSPEPVSQLSFSQEELRDLGYVLTDVLQPVDFVFSNTQLGQTINPILVKGRYYCITIGRAGAAGTGSIFTGIGNNVLEDSRETLYGGGAWVDVSEEDMWFQVWTDAAKVADGQAYDEGNGIEVEKTEVNSIGATVDYSFGEHSLVDSGENSLNTAVVQAVQEGSVEEQDERTGDTIYSRQKYEPSFSFVTSSGLNTLRETAEPLIIGAAQDVNPKSNPIIDGIQELPGLVKGDVFTIVNPDPDLLSNNLIGSKLIPNNTCNALDYRIFRVTYCVDGYGDVNGDGEINSLDVVRVTQLLGESLDSPTTQQKIIDGYITTLELLRADVDGDGYITSNDVDLITQFVSRQINSFPVGSTFDHLELQVQQSIGRYDGYFDCDGYIRLDGYTGRNVVSPGSLNPYELVYDGYLVTPNMNGADPVFDTVPYVAVPYEVKPQPFWQDYQLKISTEARLVLAAFIFDTAITAPDCTTASTFVCEDRPGIDPSFDPGRTDIQVPDNLIMRRGQIINPDGSNYKIDFEVGHIILELPEIPFTESVINIFEKLMVDAGNGFTSAGYAAMRFADCTTVQSDALAKNQVRFGVSIQAFVPNIDGYTDEDGYGVIVDDIIGVYMDHDTGILTLTVKDLSVDDLYQTLVTKIQITVYLKKGGWNNEVLVVDSDQIQGLLS
jgi:hypothetical protein